MGDAAKNQKRLHAIVEGRVQGVGFRFFVRDVANQLGCTGWVRNRWNGDVEVLAEGELKSLEQLLKEIHRGPRAAFVTNVQVEWLEASGEFSDFRVRMTV